MCLATCLATFWILGDHVSFMGKQGLNYCDCAFLVTILSSDVLWSVLYVPGDHALRMFMDIKGKQGLWIKCLIMQCWKWKCIPTMSYWLITRKKQNCLAYITATHMNYTKHPISEWIEKAQIRENCSKFPCLPCYNFNLKRLLLKRWYVWLYTLPCYVLLF